MSGHFTDRDERMWQRRAEERTARPLPLGAWLRALRAAAGARATGKRAVPDLSGTRRSPGTPRVAVGFAARGRAAD